MEQKPATCHEAILLAFHKLETPVIIGSGRPNIITKNESLTAQELAKASDCANCIGCNLKNPQRMEPLTEAYNDSVRNGILGKNKESLAAKLPEDLVVDIEEMPEEYSPNIAA